MFRGVYERIGIDPVVNEFLDCFHDSKYISVFKQLTGIDILPDNKHRRADTSYPSVLWVISTLSLKVIA